MSTRRTARRPIGPKAVILIIGSLAEAVDSQQSSHVAFSRTEI